MISLGLFDIFIFVVLLGIALFSMRRRLYGRFYIALALVIIFLIERLVPGTLSAIGNAIHSIDRLNDLGPHLTINPIITFR